MEDQAYQLKIETSRYNVRKHLLIGNKRQTSELPETVLANESQNSESSRPR